MAIHVNNWKTDHGIQFSCVVGRHLFAPYGTRCVRPRETKRYGDKAVVELTSLGKERCKMGEKQSYVGEPYGGLLLGEEIAGVCV